MKAFPERLIDGYREFKRKQFVSDSERYRALAEHGQTPETLVIACCDSRAAPETIFNARPGEIFVIRNVANLVPSFRPDGEYHATSAAIEFAVHCLSVKHIVVLGHGRCGGIRAALDPSVGPQGQGDFIGKWIGLIAPAAKVVAANQSMTGAERQTALERISIAHSIANLRTFPCVSEQEKNGHLSVHGAWFDISSGELCVMDPETGEFIRSPGVPK